MKSSPSQVRLLTILLGVVVLAVLGGCGRRHLTPPPKTGEDPYDLINIVSFDSAGSARVVPLPGSAYSHRFFARRAPGRHLKLRDKLHPLLRQWLATGPGSRRETLLVTFRDTVYMPRFPQPNMTVPRDSSVNQMALDSARTLIREIAGRRSAQYEVDSLDMARHYGAVVLRKYWIVQALLVEMPLGKVDTLSFRPGVLCIQPKKGGEPPPQGGACAATDVIQGRRRIVSDPYFDLGIAYGWMSLLDTGVMEDHRLLTNPSHLGIVGDCVTSRDCCGGNGQSDGCEGHGTSSAAIITGNNSKGDCYRGVTEITLDSFKVYYDYKDLKGNCKMGLDADATLLAFQCGVSKLDRIIVAEMQGLGSDYAALAGAADNAYDLGSVVIAACGDYGSEAVGLPAKDRKAIAVGCYDVEFPDNDVASQSWGATEDGRFKPDVQGPTNAKTAGNGDTESMRWHDATSGSTPFVAGGAALLRNWLFNASGTKDPGQIYAQLILSGQTDGPFGSSGNRREGAGPIVLPTNGWGCYGKISLNVGEKCDIPLGTTGLNIRKIGAALWWPEQMQASGCGSDTHNDLSLTLIDDTGNEVKTSQSEDGVFERATYPISSPPATGTWTLRVKAETIRCGPQDVYWSVGLFK